MRNYAAEREESSEELRKVIFLNPKAVREKTPATQEQLQNNRIVELEMKVELLQNFLSEAGRM